MTEHIEEFNLPERSWMEADMPAGHRLFAMSPEMIDVVHIMALATYLGGPTISPEELAHLVAFIDATATEKETDD